MIQKLIRPQLGEYGAEYSRPEAYMMMNNIKIFQDSINEMILWTTDTGMTNSSGTYKLTARQAGCEWVKRNLDHLKTYGAPDCITRPKPQNLLQQGDTVFNPKTFACDAIKCGNREIIKPGLTPPCELCSNANQVPNRTKTPQACDGCGAGQYPNNNLDPAECAPCAEGTSCPFGTEAPVPCPLGEYTDRPAQLGCA